MKKQILIYDIETFPNLFTVTFYDRKQKEYKQFIIHNSKNQYNEIIEYLYSKPWIMVGFNNISFDYPVIHHMINHYDEYKTFDGDNLAQCIFKKSQEIINEQFAAVAYYNEHIQQLDVYRIHHWNNKARILSLKSAQVSMNLERVEECSISFDKWIFKEEDIENILFYNKWDVYSTWQIFEITIGNTNNPSYKNRNKIYFRQDIIREYGVYCLNFPDVKIGEELLLNLYCKKTDKNIYHVKKLRTERELINLSECIPNWTFKNKVFNDLINEIKTITIGKNKTFQKSVIFHGTKLDLGLGGIHSSIKSGVYIADKDYMIIDLDIGSLYPSIIRLLNIYPEHLGEEWNKLYSYFIDIRLNEKAKPKELRNNVIIEAVKLLLNGAYGKFGEETSWLFDLKCTYRTTLFGQLFMCKWLEEICYLIPETVILQSNTKNPLVF